MKLSNLLRWLKGGNKVGMSRRNKKSRPDETREIQKVEGELQELQRLVKQDIRIDERILAGQTGTNNQVQSFQILQILPNTPQGANNMANTILGIAPGSRGSFTFQPVPANSTIPKGQIPQVVSDNPLAVVSADASGLSATVTVDASAAVGGSFNLTVSVTRTDGVLASGTANVPFIAAAAGEVQSFDITQTA